MSAALHRLKAKIAENEEEPFVGCVGGSRTPVSDLRSSAEAYVGFDRDPCRGVEKFEAGSIAEIPSPHPPSKLTKGIERQSEPFRCWICLGAEMPGRPLLPVCTDTPGLHHWMHADECWREHVRKSAAARLGAAALTDGGAS